MEERLHPEPTTTSCTAPAETTRRQLLTALTGGLMALVGLGVTTAQSGAEHKNKSKKSAQLVPLPRNR